MGGGKGDSPDPPSYQAAAKVQAEASKEITEYQTYANRPTQITPWGTVEWSVNEPEVQINPKTGQPLPGQEFAPQTWTQKITLSPEQQAALDAQMGLQQGRSELGLSLLGRAEGEFADTVDWSSFQDMGMSPLLHGVNLHSIMPDYTQAGAQISPYGVTQQHDFSGAYDVGDPTRS